MKDDINLLPPSLLAQRLRRLVLGRVGRVIAYLYGALLFVLLVQGLLYAAFTSIDRAILVPVVSRPADVGSGTDVRTLNARIRRVHERVGREQGWTNRLPDIFNAVPPAVRISSLSGAAAEDRFSVRGTTTSRAAVVDFQDALKKLPWVGHVQAPLQNLAVPTGEFTLTLILKNDTPDASR